MSVTTGDSGGRCRCGAMWFRLVASVECDEPGQVAIDERGVINAHAGSLVCAACGAPWTTPRQRLTVVRNDERRHHPTKTIRAPLTPEQVRALNRWQANGRMHPFTCGNSHPWRGRLAAIAGPSIGRFGHQRVLVATSAGWVCSDPNCDYTQDWAHAFMVNYADVMDYYEDDR